MTTKAEEALIRLLLDTGATFVDCVVCASCQELLRINSEDIINTTCQKCGNEAK